MIYQPVPFTTAEIEPFKQIMLADLGSDNQQNVESYTHFQNYYFRSPVNQLMLRKNNYTKSLTLAVIEINHPRQHSGTKIIETLEDLAIKDHYKKVIIESILTKAMWNLAFKEHYTKDQYNAVKIMPAAHKEGI